MHAPGTSSLPASWCHFPGQHALSHYNLAAYYSSIIALGCMPAGFTTVLLRAYTASKEALLQLASLLKFTLRRVPALPTFQCLEEQVQRLNGAHPLL